jgi:hypothetical protein
MKRFALVNTDLPYHLMYGGLVLSFIDTPLHVYYLTERSDFLNVILPVTGCLILLFGVLLRVYQVINLGDIQKFLLHLAIGSTLVAAMMATDIISTPSFLQYLFR